MGATGEDIFIGNGVVVHGKVGYILLMGDNVFLQLIGLVAVVSNKEGVVIRAVFDFAQGRDHLGFVAVADVVFLTIGNVSACTFRCECCPHRVDVRAVVLLGKTKGEDRSFLK